MQLTIAVPSYNAEHFLSRCLGSMADARFNGRLEVIVVDDGSTDGTAGIARQYISSFPNIFRLISQKNSGHGGAVNSAISAASGEYFRIVDADDWVDTDALASLLDSIDALSPDVFLDERIENREDTDTERRSRLPENAVTGKLLDFSAVTGPEYYSIISMHAITPRTELLRRAHVRLMEHTYYVDMRYVIGVSSFAETVVLLPLGIYHYRLGANEQSVNPANYVRNYLQHDRVLKACVSYCSAHTDAMPRGRESYMRTMLTLLTHTQYNIALIYNSNRHEGALQARALTRWLGCEIPWLKRATRSRRCTAGLLHGLGFDYDRLQHLKAVVGRL